MGNHEFFGENIFAHPKLREFPTSVGCFHEIASSCVRTQGASLLAHFVYICTIFNLYIGTIFNIMTQRMQ